MASHVSLSLLILVLLSLSTALAIEVGEGRRKPLAAPQAPPPPPPGLGVFDYYIPALQWPISFCYDATQSKTCDANTISILPKFFTIHGLWPSKIRGNPVRSGELFDLQQITSVIGDMEKFLPSADKCVKNPSSKTYSNFWRHEWELTQWEVHGRESGLTQEEYIELAIALYKVATLEVDSYFRGQAGTTITIAQMKAHFAKFGVPAAVCNNDPNSLLQLFELRFNVSKTGVFQNNLKTGCHGQGTAYLPTN